MKTSRQLLVREGLRIEKTELLAALKSAHSYFAEWYGRTLDDLPGRALVQIETAIGAHGEVWKAREKVWAKAKGES